MSSFKMCLLSFYFPNHMLARSQLGFLLLLFYSTLLLPTKKWFHIISIFVSFTLYSICNTAYLFRKATTDLVEVSYLYEVDFL
jgi:hypothetical protein